MQDANAIVLGNLEALDDSALKEAWHAAIDGRGQDAFAKVQFEMKRRSDATPAIQRRAKLDYETAVALFEEETS